MRMTLKSLLGAVLFAIASLAITPRVFSQTWIGDNFIDPYGQGNAYYWNDIQNWDTNVPLNSSAVVFDNNGINRVVNLFSAPASGLPNAVAGSISISGNGGPNVPPVGYTIGSSGQLLTVGGGAGATGNVAKSASVAQAINGNLVITGSGRTISNTAAGSFNLGGSVSTLSDASLTISNGASGGGFNFSGGGGVSSGAGALTVTNASANNISFGSSVTANGGLSVTNSAAGTVTLSGAVTNSGANALAVSNTGAGNVNINGSVTNGNGNVNVTNSSTGVVTFSGSVTRGANSVLNITNSGSVIFSGNVSGGNGVSVSGSGSVRLGDAAADSVGGGVTVGSGSLLDGLGTINGALTVNGGTYSPGLGTIGTQQLGSTLVSGAALVANAGSTFEFDLNSSSSDVIDLSGRDLTLSGAAGTDYTVRLNLLSGISPPAADPGTISWNVFTNVGNALSLDLSKLTVDSVVGNLTGTAFRTDQFFWSVTGGNTLTLSAVPEPSSMALFGLVGIGAAGFARRRMKKATKKEVA